MKKRIITVLALVFTSLVLTSCGYNNIVTLREEVSAQWANVENQYQRRADLIPNLVKTVQGYAKHESQIFEQVAKARSDLAAAVKIDGSITDSPEKLAAYQKAQDALGSSLSRLLAISESYPELKANQNFLDLQSQLEGTENRIATERKRYNDSVKEYNSEIQRFPGFIWAKYCHFEPKAYMQISEEAKKVPEVSFD